MGVDFWFPPGVLARQGFSCFFSWPFLWLILPLVPVLILAGDYFYARPFFDVDHASTTPFFYVLPRLLLSPGGL